MRIVEFYLRHPEERYRTLNIPNVSGTTYQECFWRLVNTDEPRRFAPRIFFAKLGFKNFETTDTSLLVTLDPGKFGANPDKKAALETPRTRIASYRVKYDMADWSSRRRTSFITMAELARKAQRKNHVDKSQLAVHLFFIGTQDREDPFLFHVADPRLSCFFLV